MPFGAAGEICERARPARHSSTRGRQDLRARAAGQTLERARPTRSASARGPTRSASARGQVRRGPRFHRRNLCDLQVCLCSCSGLRPYPSVTFQTTIVELIVANSAHWNSQKMLEQPRIEQSDAVALAMASRRLRGRLPKAWVKTAPQILGEGGLRRFRSSLGSTKILPRSSGHLEGQCYALVAFIVKLGLRWNELDIKSTRLILTYGLGSDVMLLVRHPAPL